MSVLYDEWSGPTDLWGGGLTEICLRPDEASSRAASIVANLRAASGWLVGGSSASTRGPDVKVGEAIAGVSFLEPHISRPWELQGSTNSR
jgi:hypothetical protein